MHINQPSADKSTHHAAGEAGLVEWRILAPRSEIGGIEYPVEIGVDHDHVSGRAGGASVAGQARSGSADRGDIARIRALKSISPL